MSSDLKKFFEEIFCQDQKGIFLSLYKGNRKRSRKDAERVRRDRPGAQSRRDGEEDRSEARERTQEATESHRGTKTGRAGETGAKAQPEGRQPAGTDRGRERSRRGSEKQTQREGETARAHSRRDGEDAEQLTSRHRSERRAGAIQSRRCGRDPGEIFGRSSNHAQPITSKNQSEAGEAKEKRRAHAMPGTKKSHYHKR